MNQLENTDLDYNVRELAQAELASIAGGMIDVYAGELHPNGRVPGRLQLDPDEEGHIAGAGL